MRHRFVDFNRRIDERRDQTRLAIQDVSTDKRRSVEEIQADLLASYRSHGIEPGSDLSGLASFLKAMSGPRLLFLPRLAKLALGGFRKLREVERGGQRWGGPDDDAENHDFDGEAKGEFQRAFRLYAIYGLVAVGLAAAARKTEGLLRIVLVGLAVVVAVASAWSALFMGGIALFIRIARARGLRNNNVDQSPVR